MTALLAMLAVAGYQHRDTIAGWMGGGQKGPQPAPGGTAAPTDKPAGLDQWLPSGGAGGLGSMIHDGLAGLVDSFKQNGHGETAQSWVDSGPNKPIAAPDLDRAIGPDTIDALAKQTGLSRAEILARLSRELPAAVDKYTPDGRLPGPA